MKPLSTLLSVILVLAVLLSACAPSPTPPAPTPQPTSLPTSTPQPTPTATPSIWIMPGLPAAFLAQVKLPSGLEVAGRPDEAQYSLQVGAGQPVSQWIYALAAPFYTLTDDVSTAQLKTLWLQNSPPAGLPVTGLLVDESTLAVFSALWGRPGSLVQALPPDKLLDAAWQAQTTWALLPFEAIQPRWKILSLDGQHPLHKDLDPATYALTVPISLTGTDAALTASQWLPVTNRDPQKLAVIDLTGVTALVRGTAGMMETHGMTYPASDEVRDLLRSADILHISNEIPFAKDCPNPYYDSNDLVFCSRAAYIELLDYIGTDVVELTGDHFADWGPEAMLYTLQLYHERGWGFYGGGENIDAASMPLKLNVNGNKIAFLGCNGKPSGYATASQKNPGAYHCRMEDMVATVKALHAEGYQVIFTFQHLEYYEYKARPPLQTDFQAVADAGAVIVSGSQAHVPHAIELRNGSFIHYGLGNMFFDQYVYEDKTQPTDKAFIDQHTFYDGRYLGVQLYTIQFQDMARSNFMLPAARAELLKSVFAVSK